MVTGKKRSKAKAAPIIQQQKLRGFHDGAGQFPNFSYSKYYWTGDGQRGCVAAKIKKKLTPGSGLGGRPSDLEAAKWELLVPAFAPETFGDLALCLNSYDQEFSAAEVNAYVQLTFRFPWAMNLHHPYELVRAFLRAEIVDGMERNLPVLLVLHKPQAAGSFQDPHVHAVCLLRRASRLGWGAYDKSLPGDQGQREIYEAWLAFKRRWEEEWPAGLTELPM